MMYEASTLQSMLSRPRIARRLVLGLIAVCSLGVLWYVHTAAMDSISRDEWRFLDILQHWYDGKFSLRDLWQTNTAGSEHRTPAFKAYFLANALWFGLDVRLGCYIGALALGGFAWAMYCYFLRTSPSAELTAFDHYAFVPVAITMFSFVQSHIYIYDLLAEFAITGSALFGVFWMQMDLQLRGPQSPWRYIGFAVALPVLLLLFGAGKGPALVLATLVIAAFIAAMNSGRGRVLALACIVAGVSAGELIYWWGGAGHVTGGGMARLLRAVLSDVGGALQYVLHALGAAFITSDGLYSYPASERSVVLSFYGAIAMTAVLAALIVYLWFRSYRRTLLPLALAVFVAGYIGELVLGRFGGGTENGGAPRYVYTNHLLVVAAVFVFADAARVIYARGRRQLAAILLGVLTVCMGAIEVHNARIEYDSLGSEIHVQNDAINLAKQSLTKPGSPYPKWYCPDDALCYQGVRFLHQHRLSFFRDADAESH